MRMTDDKQRAYPSSEYASLLSGTDVGDQHQGTLWVTDRQTTESVVGLMSFHHHFARLPEVQGSGKDGVV